jgi:hypothetical protein
MKQLQKQEAEQALQRKLDDPLYSDRYRVEDTVSGEGSGLPASSPAEEEEAWDTSADASDASDALTDVLGSAGVKADRKGSTKGLWDSGHAFDDLDLSDGQAKANKAPVIKGETAFGEADAHTVVKSLTSF